MKKSLLKTIFSFAAAPALAALTVLIAFYINGVYPFGAETLYFMDNGILLVPFYSHLYDLLSGQGGSFFYSLEAGGMPITGAYHIQALLFPSTWIIFLTGKEMMVENLSWVIVGIASLTSFIYFYVAHKKLDVFWQITFSYLYAISGYILCKHQFINFLNFMIIFPLIALGFQQLCKFRKYLLLFITLFISLVSWYYMTFPILLTTTIGIGLYAFLFLSGTERKKIILLYSIVVSSAIILSSFSWAPTISLTMNSVRCGLPIPYLHECVRFIKSPSLTENIFNIYAGAICLVIIASVKFSKIENKQLILFGAILAFLLLPLLIYPSFLVFHGGSYVCYPFRYAYIPTFIILICCAFIIEKKYIKQNIIFSSPKFNIFIRLFSITLLLTSIIGLIILYSHNNIPKGRSILGILFFIGSFIFYLTIDLKNRKSTFLYIIMGIFIFLEGTIFFMCRVPELSPLPEKLRTLEFKHAEQIVKGGIYSSYPLSRIKNKYAALPYNFSLLTKIPSLESYTHTTSKKHQDFLVSLGYDRQYTLTREEGGTMFTDALFAVTTIFTSDQLNPKFYEYSQTLDQDFYIYRQKITLPWGIIVPDSAIGINISHETNPFNAQNILFSTLSENKTLLFSTYSETNEDQSMYYMWPLLFDKHPLYRQSYGSSKNGIRELTQAEAKQYSHHPDVLSGKHSLMQINMPLFEQFARDHANDQVHFRGDGRYFQMSILNSAGLGKAVLVPLIFYPGWEATINGNDVPVEKIGELIAIRLEPGNNEITLTYWPPLLRGSLIVCGIFLALLLGTMYLYKKRPNLTLWSKVMLPSLKLSNILFWCSFWGILFIIFIFAPLYVLIYNLVR
ncbi:MAG: YfhO family protein [Akkermansia sp.]